MKINGEVEGNVPHIIRMHMPGKTRREAGHLGDAADSLNDRSESPSFWGYVPANQPRVQPCVREQSRRGVSCRVRLIP